MCIFILFYLFICSMSLVLKINYLIVSYVLYTIQMLCKEGTDR